MIEKVLDAARRKVNAAEVFSEDVSEIEVTFEAGVLKSAERKNACGIGLRVIHEGRFGFSSTTDMSRLEELVESAVACASFGKDAGFEFPPGAELPSADTYDGSVESFSPRDAVNEGKRAVAMLKEACPKGLTDLEFSASVSAIRIMNTSGLDASYWCTDFSQSIVSVIVEGDSILWIADGGHFGNLDIRTDAYVSSIADLARKAEVKAPRMTGSLPVVVTAREMPNLMESIEMGVNGRRLLKGDSPLIGREGEQVLGTVTLVDDPFIPWAPGSRSFDDEGVPSKKSILFENGVFNSFLFDLDTAAKTRHDSTASASRGMLSTPRIEPSNLVMSTGSSSLDDMVKGMDEGIIVYGVLGGGQSNLLAGDFALNVTLGFLISKGEISGRLVDTMISGNVYEAFMNIAAMGAKVKQVGSLFMPDVMFSALAVTGG